MCDDRDCVTEALEDIYLEVTRDVAKAKFTVMLGLVVFGAGLLCSYVYAIAQFTF